MQPDIQKAVLGIHIVSRYHPLLRSDVPGEGESVLYVREIDAYESATQPTNQSRSLLFLFAVRICPRLHLLQNDSIETVLTVCLQFPNDNLIWIKEMDFKIHVQTLLKAEDEISKPIICCILIRCSSPLFLILSPLDGSLYASLLLDPRTLHHTAIVSSQEVRAPM